MAKDEAPIWTSLSAAARARGCCRATIQGAALRGEIRTLPLPDCPIPRLYCRQDAERVILPKKLDRPRPARPAATS
jgi:hypothetical protein